MALIDKIIAGRQFTLEVDGHRYTLRRPTDAEALSSLRITTLDLVKRFCDGWDHTELSLGIPGGTGEPAPFSRDLWETWVEDQPTLWGPLSEAIQTAYVQYETARSQAEKN